MQLASWQLRSNSPKTSVCPSIHLLLPDRNHQSVGLWYWKLMSHPDPVVLPVGTKKSTLHSLECFWVIRRIFIYSHYNTTVFLAATKQFYEWYFLSVCPSVCLSVTPLWLCSHHRIIMKFSGVITTDQGNVHAKGQGQRSKVKVTEVTTQLDRFRTVTPVWIHIWWWNDAYSLMLLRRGALLFFTVIRQISRSHGSKNCQIWPRLGVSGL